MWLQSFLTLTVVIIFTAILLGSILQRIKIFGISFDISSILIVSIIMGGMLSFFLPDVFDTQFEKNISFLSEFGTVLFVSSIGLISGGALSKGVRCKDFCGFLIGAAMIIISVAAINVIGIIDTKTDISILYGILCGALTTTPGLSAICENKYINPDFATMAYGCTYVFGVLGTLVYTQIFSEKESVNKSDDEVCVESNFSDAICPISLAVILGKAIASIKVMGFTLGTTGGILCVSLGLGLILFKCGKRFDPKQLSLYRNLGLMMFFVGNGIKSGGQCSLNVEIKWLLYGVLMTFIPLVFGHLLTKIFMKCDDRDNMIVIAGGMTSTPAVGVLIKKCADVDLALYSFSYIGSLLTIVILL